MLLLVFTCAKLTVVALLPVFKYPRRHHRLCIWISFSSQLAWLSRTSQLVYHLNCAMHINCDHNSCKKFHEMTQSLASVSFIEANFGLPKCFVCFNFLHLHAVSWCTWQTWEGESKVIYRWGDPECTTCVQRGVSMTTPERLFAVLNKYANVIFLCQLRLNDVLTWFCMKVLYILVDWLHLSAVCLVGWWSSIVACDESCSQRPSAGSFLPDVRSLLITWSIFLSVFDHYFSIVYFCVTALCT